MADDARVGPELLVELVVAHVHGVDPLRAVLQEAVREAAGGGAGVEADVIRDVHVEGVHDGEELVGSPAHVLLRTEKKENGIRGINVSRLVHGHRQGAASLGYGHGHFAGHDEASRLLTAPGKALFKYELIRSGFYFRAHAWKNTLQARS